MSVDNATLKQLQTIIDVQARVADAALDVDAFMQHVVDAAERLTNAKGAVVELVDGEDMVYRFASAPLMSFVGMRLKRAGSLSGKCVAERHVLRCEDTEADPRVDREACRRIGVRSMICAPLFQRGEPVGVLKVMASEPQRFTQYDVQTLRLVAGALGAALGKQLEFDAKNRVEAALRESQTRLEHSEARMRMLLQHANDAVIVIDANGKVIEWNTAAERLFGWSAPEANGQDAVELIVPGHMLEYHRNELARFMATREGRTADRRVELQAVNRSGQELQVELSVSPVQIGGQWEFFGLVRDISERKALELRLTQMALEDSLTGLANRRALISAIERAVQRAARPGHPFALLYMDLNGFKKINDTHGHQAGDRALQEFARRLLSVVRPPDLVARLGGDEFAILADGVATLDETQSIIDRIHVSLQIPMTDPPLTLRTSIGVSLYRDHASASELLLEADAAMYEVKRRTRRELQSTG